MTDNEIIKAFECCNSSEIRCEECPYYPEHLQECEELEVEVLNLINRQKAEIEVAKNARTLIFNVNQGEMATVVFNHVKETESEAIKEFAERLKKKADIVSGGDYGFTYEITEDELDNLVKEMTEQRKE